MPQAGTYV